MINRVLIRIKVLQIVFSYYQNETNNLKAAESELHLSLRKAYDLYHFLLYLIVELTSLYERVIDARKHKYMPTEADLNPNTRLIENPFAQQLSKNIALNNYVQEYKLSWQNQPDYLRSALDLMLKSDIYKGYINNADHSYEAEKEFWRATLKNVVFADPNFEELLEDLSIYWNDDIEIVKTFVLKTINRFDPAKGAEQELLPMFKDNEDRDFAFTLLRETILNAREYQKLIDKHLQNWESERIADMDYIIMQIAISELLHFPSIPISVTLNEYIEIAKYYSTPKSSTFINGILDSVVAGLKKEQLLLKD